MWIKRYLVKNEENKSILDKMIREDFSEGAAEAIE